MKGEPMSSLPTTEAANIDKFYDVIRTLDPELYLIKVALQERQEIDPMLIPQFIRSLGNLMLGSGYGRVITFVQDKKATQIRSEELVDVSYESVHYEERKR